MSKEMTLQEAKNLRANRLAVMAADCPLRFRPVVVAGPTGGFVVVELGFALRNDLVIAR